MNLVTKKLCFVILASAVAFSGVGCRKKPKRPDPSATMIGPDGLNTTGIPTDGMLADANSGLGNRSGIDGAGDRETLAAQTVYFDFDQSGIKASERTKLNEAKAYLDANPTARLLLEGHCDWKGTAEYNLGLGDRRANAVKQFLTTSGVAEDKFEVLSKGDLDAIENSDEATAAKDRRVNLVVLKP